jgi:hypothetical protein
MKKNILIIAVILLSTILFSCSAEMWSAFSEGYYEGATGNSSGNVTFRFENHSNTSVEIWVDDCSPNNFTLSSGYYQECVASSSTSALANLFQYRPSYINYELANGGFTVKFYD